MQAHEHYAHVASREARNEEKARVQVIKMFARPRAAKSFISDPESSCVLLSSVRLQKVHCEGGTISALCLTLTKLIATYQLREKNLCLQLYTHWRPHQSPTDNPNPMVSETALAALNGPQNKTESHKSFAKGTGSQSGLTEVGGS